MSSRDSVGPVRAVFLQFSGPNQGSLLVIKWAQSEQSSCNSVGPVRAVYMSKYVGPFRAIFL